MKPTKLQTKIVKILFILLIPLLLTAVVLLSYELIKNKISLYSTITSTIFMIYMVVFVVFLIFTLTKYRKDFNLGKEKPFMRTFATSLFIFMIIFGLIEILIFKTWRNVHILILGVVLLISDIILTKRIKNKTENKILNTK